MLILHDLNLAAQYSDRVIMLKDGRMIAAGPASDVLTEETIYETFAVPVVITKHPRLECPLIVPTVRSK